MVTTNSEQVAILTTGVRDFILKMPMAVGIFNREGVYVEKNDISLLGFRPQDVLGKNLKIGIPPYNYGLIEPLLSAVIDYGRIITNLSFDFLAKDKEIVAATVSCMPCRWDGNIFMFVSAQRSHALRSVESLAEGNLATLYAIQKQLHEMKDSITLLKTMVLQ